MKPLSRCSLSLAVALGGLACSAEAPLPLDATASAEEGAEASGVDEEADGQSDEARDSVGEALAQAPGFVPFAYPAPPYGVRTGAILENLEFLGWHDPMAAGFDLNAAQTVSLADFYDPDGQKGIELLMINAVAVWCGVCRTEYADIRSDGIYAEYAPRGLEVLGILFEDNEGGPADYTDLINWSNSYQVNFPFVLDPGFKTGVYFDRSATPMNMLVDARTMQILSVMTGYNPQVYEVIDGLLAERGR